MGKDEMNLAEFPLTKLGTRDQRDVLVYEGWILDTKKRPCRQSWTVRGASGIGLPNEFGDRVMLALIYLTFEQGLPKPKVEFSRYQLLKLVGQQTVGSKDYQLLEKTLLQIAGMTIESDQAFFDKASNKRLVTKKAFHVLDNLWLNKQVREEYDAQSENTDGVGGFVVWGREFWSNLQSGYIKNLDLGFYYKLTTPLARRLYRLLDKRMHHKDSLEMDVFDLAARLGQSVYRKPSEVLRKMQPSLQELVERQFLSSFEMVKRGQYSRVRFVRTDGKQFAQTRVAAIVKQTATSKLEAQYKTTGQQLDVWQQVKKALKSKLSAPQYSIVADSDLLSLDDKHAVICVPHAFAAQWIQAHSDVVLAVQAALSSHIDNLNVPLEFVDRRVGETTGSDGSDVSATI